LVHTVFIRPSNTWRPASPDGPPRNKCNRSTVDDDLAFHPRHLTLHPSRSACIPHRRPDQHPDRLWPIPAARAPPPVRPVEKLRGDTLAHTARRCVGLQTDVLRASRLQIEDR
jgi:hypothetical protein